MVDKQGADLIGSFVKRRLRLRIDITGELADMTTEVMLSDKLGESICRDHKARGHAKAKAVGVR